MLTTFKNLVKNGRACFQSCAVIKKVKKGHFLDIFENQKHASPKTCNLARKYVGVSLVADHIWSHENLQNARAFLW